MYAPRIGNKAGMHFRSPSAMPSDQYDKPDGGSPYVNASYQTVPVVLYSGRYRFLEAQLYRYLIPSLPPASTGCHNRRKSRRTSKRKHKPTIAPEPLFKLQPPCLLMSMSKKRFTDFPKWTIMVLVLY